MVSNFFQRVWDNTPTPFLPIITFDPDQKKKNNQRIIQNLLTNQYELSATVLGNTNTY